MVISCLYISTKWPHRPVRLYAPLAINHRWIQPSPAETWDFRNEASIRRRRGAELSWVDSERNLNVWPRVYCAVGETRRLVTPTRCHHFVTLLSPSVVSPLLLPHFTEQWCIGGAGFDLLAAPAPSQTPQRRPQSLSCLVEESVVDSVTILAVLLKLNLWLPRYFAKSTPGQKQYHPLAFGGGCLKKEKSVWYW